MFLDLREVSEWSNTPHTKLSRPYHKRKLQTHFPLFEGVPPTEILHYAWVRSPPTLFHFWVGESSPTLVAFLVPPAVSPNDPPHTHHQAFPDRQMRPRPPAARPPWRICRSGKAWWWVWGGSLGETAGGTRNATRVGGDSPTQK